MDVPGLTLAAAVGTGNDSRGPFSVDVPFIYNSSLRVSGSVHAVVFVAPLSVCCTLVEVLRICLFFDDFGRMFESRPVRFQE